MKVDSPGNAAGTEEEQSNGASWNAVGSDILPVASECWGRPVSSPDGRLGLPRKAAVSWRS